MTMPTTPEGTMPKVEGSKTPEAEGKTPEVESKEPSEEKLYTQKQLDAFIHATKSEAGRTEKELVTERDTLKSQIQTKEGELEDIQEERETLNKQIEDLSSDDPKKFDLIKKDRELRDRERKSKEKERTLEAQERVNAGRIAKADAFEVELHCESIADEYEGGDSKMLHKICKTAGVKTEEAIRNLADTLWSKQSLGKSTEPPKEPLKAYSGITDGGKDLLGNLSPKERLQEADRRLRV